MTIRTKFDGYSADGMRRLHKGGGGGSANYANLDALYKEQTDSARLLREQAEANLPGAVQSYVNETREVLDPGYAEKQASVAGADLTNANAQERAATEKKLVSMGVNPSDPRFAGSMRSTELTNTARMAAGKNASRQQANNYQLNVAKDAVGTFTGQSNQAATQMGNASSGLGSVYASQANSQMANQQVQSNNVGNAVGASIAAYGIYNQPTTKKDGGRIKKAKYVKRIKLPAGLKRVERHAMGGGVGGNQGFFQMQSIAPPPVAQAPQQGGSPVASAIGTANTIKGLYNAGAKKGGEAAAKKGAEAAVEKAAGQKAGEVAATQTGQQAGAIVADTAAAGATKAAATTAATEATTAAATTAATDAAVTAAVPAVAETAAGSGLMAGMGTAGAAVGAAMPWVGAAMVAGSLLDLWNAGGEVGTQNEGMSEAEASARFAKADQNGTIQDIRHGGKVPGEWKGNTDNVPALLTEDEHVINAEAAAMVGHDKLEQLNKQGLALRKQGYTPGRIKAAGGIRRAA